MKTSYFEFVLGLMSGIAVGVMIGILSGCSAAQHDLQTEPEYKELCTSEAWMEVIQYDSDKVWRLVEESICYPYDGVWPDTLPSPESAYNRAAADPYAVPVKYYDTVSGGWSEHYYFIVNQYNDGEVCFAHYYRCNINTREWRDD